MTWASMFELLMLRFQSVTHLCGLLNWAVPVCKKGKVSWHSVPRALHIFYPFCITYRLYFKHNTVDHKWSTLLLTRAWKTREQKLINITPIFLWTPSTCSSTGTSGTSPSSWAASPARGRRCRPSTPCASSPRWGGRRGTPTWRRRSWPPAPSWRWDPGCTPQAGIRPFHYVICSSVMADWSPHTATWLVNTNLILK